MDMTENDKNTALFEQRPWGSFTILDEKDNFKVKRLEVLPEKRLSYQRHQKAGRALVRRPRHC